jgi:hypothetical protein
VIWRRGVGLSAVALLLWLAPVEAAPLVTGRLVYVLTQGTSVTVAQATTSAQAAAVWIEAITRGQVVVTPQIATVNTAASCADPGALGTEVIAQLGDPRPWRTVVVATGCPFSGWGAYEGDWLVLNDTVSYVLAHEYGHTFDYAHNGAGESFDIMSNGRFSFPSTPHLGKLEWLLQTGGFTHVGPQPHCYWETCHWQPAWDALVMTSGTYAIAPLSGTATPQAVRTPTESDAQGRITQYLYLEYRVAGGQDAVLATNPRVVLHVGPAYNGFQDPSNGGAAGQVTYLAALDAGGSYIDAVHGLRVTVLSLGETATVALDLEYVAPPPPPTPSPTDPPPPPPCWPPKSKRCR